jgi:hypothetical protein
MRPSDEPAPATFNFARCNLDQPQGKMVSKVNVSADFELAREW